MKINEQYIDNIINDTASIYLSEKFDLKQRFKNGIQGFNVGGDYQKSIDTYVNKEGVDELIKTFINSSKILQQYYNYFNNYEGNDNDIHVLNSYIDGFNDGINKLIKVFNKSNGITESLGNRLRGFGNGFMRNKNYGRATLSQDTFMSTIKVDDIFSSYIKPAYEGLLKEIKILKHEYKFYKKFTNTLTNLENIINYLYRYINSITYKNAENDAKESLYNHLDNLTNFGDDYSNETETPDAIGNGMSKVGNYLKGKTKKYFPNLYNNMRKLASEE